MTVILALHKQKLLKSFIPEQKVTGVSQQKGVRCPVFHRSRWKVLATTNYWKLREVPTFLKNRRGLEQKLVHLHDFIMSRDNYWNFNTS